MSDTPAVRRLRPSIWALLDELNETSVLELYRALIAGKPSHHVCLLLASPGGNSNLTTGLISSIRRKGFQTFETRAIADCSSSAIDLLALAGDLRTCEPHVTLFTHAATQSPEVRPYNAAAFAARARAEDDYVLDLYARRCGGTRRRWRDFFSRDRFLSPDDALSLGLIDRILEPAW